MLTKLLFTLTLCSLLSAKFPNVYSKNFKDGTPAIGFQYDSGAAWSILCNGTPYGTVPGKLDGAGGAYYPWGWKEHPCDDYDLVFGKLVYYTSTIPEDCKPKGFQTNDNTAYYNAVILSEHGRIPGKGIIDKKMAWYSYGGQEFPVHDNFYIIC